jgi:Raf kinase inhibitor-like YbhB/YbcL family protein
MRFQSQAFPDTGEIPRQHAYDGDDQSPALSWCDIPKGAVSLAIVMVDLDHPDPGRPTRPLVHWISYNIPPGTEGLIQDAGCSKEQRPQDAKQVGRQGTNSWKEQHYRGPSPRHGRHRYEFTLYALNSMLVSDSALSRTGLRQAIKGKIIGQATFYGHYESKLSTRKFLFSNNPIIGRLVAARPRSVGIALASASILLLVFPAWLLDIHWREHGFWRQWNWALLYTIVIPSFFALTAHFLDTLRDATQRLSHRTLRVVRTASGEPAWDFPEYISDQLGKRSKFIAIGAICVAIGLTAIDTWTLWTRYAECLGQGSCEFKGELLDWSSSLAHRAPSQALRNLIFNIIAYSFQTIAVFLWLFITIMFWLYLKSLSSALVDDSNDFKFVPMVHDLEKRLGLGAMGKIYDVFLYLIVIFQLYILLHRFQLIVDHEPSALRGSYIAQAVAAVKDLSILTDAKFYGWDTMTRGMWLLVIFMSAPIIVITYFPILVLRRYIKDRRDLAYNDCSLAYNEAKAASDEEKSGRLKAEMELLEGASVWPNGDTTARRFLWLMATLGIGSIFPPLVVVIAVGLKLTEIVVSKFAK